MELVRSESCRYSGAVADALCIGRSLVAVIRHGRRRKSRIAKCCIAAVRQPAGIMHKSAGAVGERLDHGDTDGNLWRNFEQLLAADRHTPRRPSPYSSPAL